MKKFTELVESVLTEASKVTVKNGMLIWKDKYGMKEEIDIKDIIDTQSLKNDNKSTKIFVNFEEGDGSYERIVPMSPDDLRNLIF
jgi:hypothetical protein